MTMTPMQIDYESGQAVYRQIVDHLKVQVASGELAPGVRLPSIRSLAGNLKINSRTVIRAYEELQREGLVVMRQGQGVFVTKNRDSIPLRTRRKILAERSRQFLADAINLGADVGEVVQAIEEAANKLGLEQRCKNE